MPLAREVAPGVAEIGPQPGPQAQFLSTPADIAFYGGEAGGGKSIGLLLIGAQCSHVKGFGGILLRRNAVDLIGPGSLWQESQDYRLLGGRPVTSPVHTWTWPSGAAIEMRHLQYEDDKYAHQSKQYAMVGFDEVTQFTATQFWYMISRLRSTCGVKPFARATCNPDADSWVKKLIESGGYLDENGQYALDDMSGVIRWIVRDEDTDEIAWFDTEAEALEAYPTKKPLSFTFIRSRLEDNPALTAADADYTHRLDVLSRVERLRLKGGDWRIRHTAGTVFQRSWFRVIDSVPAKDIKRSVRFWDRAATEAKKGKDPAYTSGVLVHELTDGSYVVAHEERGQWTPGKVDDRIEAIAEQDGKRVTVGLWQDPGQAGVDQAQRHTKRLAGYTTKTIPAKLNKIEYASPVSSLAEHGHIKILLGPWNEAYLSALEGFPDAKIKDPVDATSGCFQVLTKRSRFTEAMARVQQDW